jgi:hypothetical protein
MLQGECCGSHQTRAGGHGPWPQQERQFHLATAFLRASRAVRSNCAEKGADQSGTVVTSFNGAEKDLLCCGHTLWCPSGVFYCGWYQRHLRCTFSTFTNIVPSVEAKWTSINPEFDIETRVGVTMNYLTHEGSYQVAGSFFGVSKTQAIAHVDQVYTTLLLRIYAISDIIKSICGSRRMVLSERISSV